MCEHDGETVIVWVLVVVGLKVSLAPVTPAAVADFPPVQGDLVSLARAEARRETRIMSVEERMIPNDAKFENECIFAKQRQRIESEK